MKLVGYNMIMRFSRVMYGNSTVYIFLSQYILDEAKSIPGLIFGVGLRERSNCANPGFLLNPGEFILPGNSLLCGCLSLYFVSNYLSSSSAVPQNNFPGSATHSWFFLERLYQLIFLADSLTLLASSFLFSVSPLPSQT